VSKEFHLEEYQYLVLSEVEKEARELDPVRQRCYVVSFVSRSAGRGKKRREREVELLVVDNSYAFIIKNNEIRPRKKRDRVAIDVLANEILSDLPRDERTVDRLLERARGITKNTF
jgi:hypothetical protein